MNGQTQLAKYILAAAEAHERSYDKEASDAAIAAIVPVAATEDDTRVKPAPVTSVEIRSRNVMVNGEPHMVEKCFKTGEFLTDKGFRGLVSNVIRCGRKHVYNPAIVAERAAPVSQHIDFSKFQRMNYRQAVESCVPMEWRQPVYLLLVQSWNDALDWAKYEVAKAETGEGQNYAFDITFKPEGEPVNVVTHQIHADNELAAAFKIGQVFDTQFGVDFTIERNLTTYEMAEVKS